MYWRQGAPTDSQCRHRRFADAVTLVAMVMHCGMQRRCRDSALGVAVCERSCKTSVATVAARCCAISMLLLCTRCATVLPPSFTTAYQLLLQVCITVRAACVARGLHRVLQCCHLPLHQRSNMDAEVLHFFSDLMLICATQMFAEICTELVGAFCLMHSLLLAGKFQKAREPVSVNTCSVLI